MSKTRVYLQFIAIILLAAAAFFIVADFLPLVKIPAKFPFRLGLDLQGGTHLVYEGDLASIPEGDRSDAMSSVREVIERRVNAYCVAEPVVQISGGNRLIVELPGVKDLEGAVKQIGLTPFLEFRALNPDYQPPSDPNQIDLQKQFKPS